MTVRALAEAVGKTPGYLSRIESRDEVPAPDLICVLSDVLSAEAQMLLDLAKKDLLERTEQQIQRKNSQALNLYRRSL